ncbi:hypothetical protein Isop_1301 [Isosphaera pallida ATCC 43644]|uniref:Uncharacterized protein n=1 Tax=Isosphaera pallida (strain ATCC 43644 / DSM 9630 / IS1B) TaxID=575540 RepID=E8QWJ5_ISOPI|nr:hypothetical protein Isop_1301 [Isosphaera pallida ATCC 43644]
MSRHDGDDEREFTVAIVYHSGLLHPDNGDRVGPDPHAGCGRCFVVSYEISRPQTKRPPFHTLQAGKTVLGTLVPRDSTLHRSSESGSSPNVQTVNRSSAHLASLNALANAAGAKTILSFSSFSAWSTLPLQLKQQKQTSTPSTSVLVSSLRA